MAQWLGQFGGNTHRTAVFDAEELLRHAVVACARAARVDKPKKAKAVRRLAKRLLAVRTGFLKAQLGAATSPALEDVLAQRASEIARLELALAQLTSAGIEQILEEFSASGPVDAPTIRRAVAEDAPAICDVHLNAITEVCSLDYSPEEIAGWVAGKTSTGYRPSIEANDFFVASLATQVVGFSEFDPETHEVSAVYVHPDQLGRGIGATLLNEVEAAARARRVSSVHLHATINAMSFYLASGYSIDHMTILRLRGGASLRCALMRKALSS